MKILFSIFRKDLHLYTIFYRHTHTPVRQTVYSESLITQRDESGDSRLEGCVVICSYFVVDVIAANVLVVIVRIGTAHQSSSEYVVVCIRTVVSVPVTCGWRVGARTAKIFIAWDMPLIEGLSSFWMRSSVHFHSLLTTLFDVGDFRRRINI